jgi:hypothetical protein
MAPSPTSLRIVHTGCAGLRLELGSGAVLVIDPAEDPGPVDAIALTWNEAERLQGAVEAVGSGRQPTVAARPEIQDWLRRHGALLSHPLGHPLAGLHIEAESYTPVPYATPAEALRKARSGLVDPLRAARRLATRARLPAAPPLVLRATLPDGRALVHLNCALHRDTPAPWLDDLAQRWAGADWLLASWDYGEGRAFAERVEAFGAERLLITDLVGQVRQRLGLPVDTRSLVADALAERGHTVHMLAAGTSLRFA